MGSKHLFDGLNSAEEASGYLAARLYLYNYIQIKKSRRLFLNQAAILYMKSMQESIWQVG